MIDWANKKVIILDRDGVINHDSDAYVKSADEWLPIAGSLAAIAALNSRFRVAIATNQSGIGRGFYDESVLDDMHQKMAALLDEQGGHIDHIEFCPHHPDDGCDCRKPKPTMLKRIAETFSATTDEVVFIGDSKSDFECAENFGCDFILVLTGKGLKTLDKLAGKDLVVAHSMAKIVEEIA
ncbi:D-glycero-beta-D-manno-heptose 1,7-bisphosphate 7-phosphatase [Kangiella japonica]|uniref:D,D-heptose 1,7-bisphosphate phosphatase n=1 Tax=Kangiella japonica TaxID=647384 RepID=A0ABN0T183_9GAMM